jgi:hypothetical protein
MLPRFLWIMETTVRWAVFREPAEAQGFLAHGQKWSTWEGEVAVLTEKMVKDWGPLASVMFLTLVSVVGLVLIPVLVLQPNLIHVQVSIRHGLVGTLYLIICVLGISAVFYPSKCKSLFGKAQNPLTQARKTSLQIRGHHPDCQNYSANRIKVGGQVICAACSGLFIGAVSVFIGTVLYFFVGLEIVGSSIWLLVLGEICIVLGLAQIKFSGYVKMLVNVVFVVGSFVTLVETDLLGGSILVDFYVLGLILFILWFRILLSEWNNGRTCEKCQLCFH